MGERDECAGAGDVAAGAFKYDAKKLRWDLLPMDAVERVVEVLSYGAAKYRPRGWMLVPDARERYFAALMRHLAAWRGGEAKDPESGLHHLSHALCNLIFLVWFETCRPEGADDVRP